MIKQKLVNKRKERGLSQEDMAFKLGMEQSQYCRRENGKTRISKKEWNSMAKILETTLEEIYEPQDGVYIINNENANGEYSGSQNHFGNVPEFLVETMRKYIKKLEEENENLKSQFNKNNL